MAAASMYWLTPIAPLRGVARSYHTQSARGEVIVLAVLAEQHRVTKAEEVLARYQPATYQKSLSSWR